VVNSAGPYLLSASGPPRPWRGILLCCAGLAVVTLVLLPVRGALSLAAVALLYLVPVLAAAVTGGFWPALAGAVAADVLVNFLFVPPYHTLRVDSVTNVVVLVVYLLVAATVAVAVEVAAQQRATAVRRGVEAELLARVTAAPATAGSLADLLSHVRVAYRMDSVALLDGDRVIDRVGPDPSGPPALVVDASAGLRLAAWGPSVFAEDRGTLSRLAAAAARLNENRRLADEAAHARELAEVDRLRAALLNAVGHDLRTPLAGIKAAVSSLRQPDIDWAPGDRAELLATLEESTDRMAALVENLLSLSRLQAGVLSADPRPIAVDAVVAEAILHTAGKTDIDVDVPDNLPPALADPGLLERVLANLLTNAVTASTPETPVRVEGRVAGDRVHLGVIDHGPGLPIADRDRLFAPFQRLNDSSGAGLGLGLAIARGFTEAMSGTLTPSDTPGGGLTMTVDLPIAT
jgi:two-component system, OmpR family, sensor histidine kinase KdpD